MHSSYPTVDEFSTMLVDLSSYVLANKTFIAIWTFWRVRRFASARLFVLFATKMQALRRTKFSEEGEK